MSSEATTTEAPMHRTLLFAPGIRPDLMTKAEGAGADALVFDLEDSVAHEAKAEARLHVNAALRHDASLPAWVRIAHPSAGHLLEDLACLAGARLQGLLLPKAEHPDEIARLHASLDAVESRLGMPNAALSIVPMIETCLGVRHAYDLVRASPRVRGVALATAEEGDLMLDLGGRWTPGGEAMAYSRSRVVCEARAAGIGWLIDGVFMNLRDDAALRVECELARNMGFVAKLAIHPRQVPVMHEVFTPGEAEIDYAHGLLAAFAEAEATGRGALQYRGMMVDYANVKRARMVLRRAAGAARR